MSQQAQNRPKKGDILRVDPIRERRDIVSIRKLLADSPRNLCLFVLGINTNLRASDLLALTAGHVRGCVERSEIVLREKKTQKVRKITLNRSAAEAIQKLLASVPLADDAPLFYSQRGKVLTVSSVNRLVKSWCAAVRVPGRNFGAHTLRKTFGYQQRMAGVDIPTLMTMFNHSTQRQTLEYLGIQPQDVEDAYLNLNL